MSTGLECWFLETEPGKWYYFLEHDNAPKNAWSWLDYADAYGPFTSEEQAMKHLDDNHANPGGHTIDRYSPTRKLSDKVQALINKTSAKPKKRPPLFDPRRPW